MRKQSANISRSRKKKTNVSINWIYSNSHHLQVVEGLPTRFERFMVFLKPPALPEVTHSTFLGPWVHNCIRSIDQSSRFKYSRAVFMLCGRIEMEGFQHNA